jgi:hypothetical protein
MAGVIAAPVKIHGDGVSFLLKRFAPEIGAEDQKGNGLLDATGATEICIMCGTRSLS